MTDPIGKEREFIERLSNLVGEYETLPPAQVMSALLSAAIAFGIPSVEACRSVDSMVADYGSRPSPPASG